MRKVADESKIKEVGVNIIGAFDPDPYVITVFPSVSGLKAVEIAFPNSEISKMIGACR